MNIKVETYKNWIHIFNRNRLNEEEGCWFIYVPQNIRNHDKDIVRKMKDLVNEHGFIRCDIELNYYDTIRIFTTCDRFEIYNAKKAIIESLGVDIRNMYWVSMEESSNFRSNNGWLRHLNTFFSNYREEDAIKQKNKGKSRYREEKQLKFEELRLNIYQYTLEDRLMDRKSITIRPIFGNVNYDIDPQFVFVLMPFGEEYSDGLYGAIKELCKEVSLKVMRADDFMNPGVIMEDIWEGIQKAGIIIADITTHNPNVFYELGIAHTIGKEVILIRGVKGEKSPFDIISRRYLEYNHMNMYEFKSKLKPVLDNYIDTIK